MTMLYTYIPFLYWGHPPHLLGRGQKTLIPGTPVTRVRGQHMDVFHQQMFPVLLYTQMWLPHLQQSSWMWSDDHASASPYTHHMCCYDNSNQWAHIYWVGIPDGQRKQSGCLHIEPQQHLFQGCCSQQLSTCGVGHLHCKGRGCGITGGRLTISVLPRTHCTHSTEIGAIQADTFIHTWLKQERFGERKIEGVVCHVQGLVQYSFCRWQEPRNEATNTYRVRVLEERYLPEQWGRVQIGIPPFSCL